MLLDWIADLQGEFSTVAAYSAAAVFVSTIPVCIYRQRWPETAHLLLMLLSTIGAMSGLKIMLATLYLPTVQLGALAGDRPGLLVGSIATLVLSLREAVGNWRRVAAA